MSVINAICQFFFFFLGCKYLLKVFIFLVNLCDFKFNFQIKVGFENVCLWVKQYVLDILPERAVDISDYSFSLKNESSRYCTLYYFVKTLIFTTKTNRIKLNKLWFPIFKGWNVIDSVFLLYHTTVKYRESLQKITIMCNACYVLCV